MPFVGRSIPIIFFVILPAVLITSGTVLFILNSYIGENETYRLIYAGIVIIVLAVSISYASIRAHYINKYLRQGLEDAVIEFQTVKKIIFLILSIPIVFIVIPNVIADTTDGKAGTWYFYVDVFFEIVGVQFLFVAISSLLMYGLVISKKESRFYLSKACFTIALHKKDIFEQMYYFGSGLQEYNKYLKRHLKHQIKDIDKIFTKVSLLDNETKTKLICSLSNSFETENDKLKPTKYISSELMKSEDIETFLIPESLKSQIKVVGAVLAASIPIVISIITLLLSRIFVK